MSGRSAAGGTVSGLLALFVAAVIVGFGVKIGGGLKR